MSVVTISSSAAQRPIFAGVDVGGTSIKIGLVDDRGRTIGATKIVTRADAAVSVAIAEVNQALRSLCEEHRVSYDEVLAVGLGTPGTMDIPGGMILEPPNLPGWRHFPIRDALATACERPVTFANDAGDRHLSVEKWEGERTFNVYHLWLVDSSRVEVFDAGEGK